MDRRGFLRSTVATSTAGLLAGVLADTDAALAYDGEVDLTSLQTTVEKISRGYNGQPPEDVLSQLVDELAGAGPLMRLHHPRQDRLDLARAIGQLGGMAAIVLHDMGRSRDALACFTTAEKAAKQAGDRSLRAWVLARKAMVPLNWGAPLVAARIAGQARQAAGRADTAAAAAALAASVAARAHAIAGATKDANNALQHADRIAGKLSVAESADTWLGYGLQKHFVHRSQALTHLKASTLAAKSQEAGLALSSETGMTRTLLLLDGAMCVRHDGDPAGGCQAAVDALTRRPGSYRAGLVRQRAAELYASVPASDRNLAEAQRLADLLAEAA
ncbi:hypothetical protein [Actinoplanes siamensis]|uniref:hypothetical protein n=1 Tax=Actinoplanes siamensis TaxID=1223317 RepID=UPI0019437CD9|nr:hypothetical protein [Actinoplanes siamensis]